MSSPAKARPRVFISYSHDSKAHKARVRALSDRLVTEGGLLCELDDYEDSPSEGWLLWMQSHVQNAEFVLMVCTETYQRRIEGREAPGYGAGVSWEGRHITQALYDQNGRNERFIPVVLSSDDLAYVPTFLKPHTPYDLSSEEEFRRLV